MKLNFLVVFNEEMKRLEVAVFKKYGLLSNDEEAEICKYRQ